MSRLWLLLLVPSTLCAQPLVDRHGDALPDGAVARLGTARWRQGEAAHALAFAPDGQILASAGGDGFVRLWERKTGRELTRLAGHRGDVRCLAFSRDGKRLLSGGIDETLRLWDVATGKELRQLLTGKGWLEAVAVSPKGSRLAAVTADMHTYLWEADGDRALGSFSIAGSVSRLAFSQDGDALFLDEPGEKDALVWAVMRRWPSGAVVRRIGPLSDFCLLPDGRSCAVARYAGRPELFDIATGKATQVLKGESTDLESLALACSPDGQLLAVASRSGVVRTWNLRTGEPLRTIKEAGQLVHTLAFSPDNRTLAVAEIDGRIALWDAVTGKPEQTPAGHRLGIVGVVAVGEATVTASRDGSLRWWDATGKQIRMVAIDECASVAVSPDGRTLAVGTARGQVHLLEARTGEAIDVLKGHARDVTSLVFLGDGRLLSGSADRSIGLWDVAKPRQTETIQARDGAGIGVVAATADGREVLAVGPEARVRRWEIGTGKEGSEIEGHIGGCLALAASPAGHVVVSGGRDDLLRIWELASGRERRVLSGGGGWVHSATWSRDGKLLASGHADGRVCLWDGRSGLRLRILHGHRGAVTALTFSKDGTRLVSGGVDSTGLVWDVAALRARQPVAVPLSEAELKRCWTALRSPDAVAAGESIQRLASDPERAVALIRHHVKPVTDQEVKQLLADLDARSFQVRTKARERLLQLGRFLEPALRGMLESKPSLEVRRRVEDILDAVTRAGLNPEGVQVLRGVELLEMVGTEAATKVLGELATGSPACTLTREAQASLNRLRLR